MGGEGPSGREAAESGGLLWTALLLVLGSLVFLLADRVLERMEGLWRLRLRKRFFRA